MNTPESRNFTVRLIITIPGSSVVEDLGYLLYEWMSVSLQEKKNNFYSSHT